MSEGWGATLMVIGAVPDAGADHLQLHRAAALRPEHGGLRDRHAGLGGVLGVPLGADRAGPLQPADGLPGGAGPLHPAARVPLRAPGRRAGAGRRHQLLPAAAGPRPGRGREPDHRADEGGRSRPSRSTTRCSCRRWGPSSGTASAATSPRTTSSTRSRRSARSSRTSARAGSGRGRRRAGRGRRRPPAAAPAEPPIPIFGCPAHDAEDRAALEMLQRVLDPARWDLEVIAPATLTAELLDRVAERRPGGGLHRDDPARRPGAHPIPVQAAAVAVPRPEDPRGPLGDAGHHDDRAGPRGRRRSRGRRPQGGRPPTRRRGAQGAASTR